MSQDPNIELPSRLENKLESYRKRVWIVKILEGVLAALFGLVLSFLVVFALDRFIDTPGWARLLIFALGIAGFGLFLPLKLHRWIWQRRSLQQVARLLRVKFPRLGDQLLGIVELAKEEKEGLHSKELVSAAMKQVDEKVGDEDFSDAVPEATHWRWAGLAALVLALAVAAFLMASEAARNAIARWINPMGDTERYTFAQLDNPDDELVVPLGEEHELQVGLKDGSKWKPVQATAKFPDRIAVTSAKENNDQYSFLLQPRSEPGTLQLKVGDARHEIKVRPEARPELSSIGATVDLPDYLEYSRDLDISARGGSLSLLKGSTATLTAEATRELAVADVDGEPLEVEGALIKSAPEKIDGTAEKTIAWKDVLGLEPKEPVVISIEAVEDEAPEVLAQKVTEEQVVLEGETVVFELRVEDDFGVKQVGLEWEGIEDKRYNPNPAKGSKVVYTGSPEERLVEMLRREGEDVGDAKTGLVPAPGEEAKESEVAEVADPAAEEKEGQKLMTSAATFQAKREGVGPQTLKIRAYAEDYLPDRERTYSPMFVVHVLSPEDHAMWITEQFSKWFKLAQEVHEREIELHETNKMIRDMEPGDIDAPENRSKLEQQASAEKANGRRLENLTNAGQQLVQEATKNDEFEANQLESMATMMQKLEDMAKNRMPSVADLLKEAADAPAGESSPGEPGEPSDSKPGEPGKPSDGQGKPSEGKPSESKPSDGNSSPSDPSAGKPEDIVPSESKGSSESVGEQADNKGAKPKPSEGGSERPAPSINDTPKGYLDKPKEAEGEQPPSKGGKGALGLPSTTLQADPDAEPPPPAAPAGKKADEAVKEQKKIIDDFAAIADQFKELLGSLEASTFVKRLKAASQRQMVLARDINKALNQGFGLSEDEVEQQRKAAARVIGEKERVESETVQVIVEDLQAYFHRKQDMRYKGLIDNMKDAKIVRELASITNTVRVNLSGRSMVSAEFWADTMDRWAEELVAAAPP